MLYNAGMFILLYIRYKKNKVPFTRIRIPTVLFHERPTMIDYWDVQINKVFTQKWWWGVGAEILNS